MDPREAGEEAARALREAALLVGREWEFRTFRCGTTVPGDVPEADAEAFRRAANRAMGTALEEEWRGERVVDFARPEATLVLRVADGRVDVDPAPLFLYGRYRKRERGVAQTPFHCPACRGRGCGGCGGSGRLAERSIAEFLLPFLVEAAGAEEGAFHGCGREDADVLMLGRGRPFAVSLERPRRRTLDLPALAAAATAAAAGAAEFPFLLPSSRAEMVRVTTTHPAKRYRARVEVEGGATEADAAALAAGLSGALLAQRTPERVARRRADRVRERRVLEAAARLLPDGALELEVRTEGGTYVKEMISGDGGRTAPSAASILSRPCRCAALDVLEVELEDPAAPGPP